MHSGNLLHAAVHPTFPLTFPVVNSTISRFIDCTSQSHTSLHLFMLPSQVRFVESVVSSLHVPVKLNLLYHKPGQETFRRAFTDSKPGRPILRLSTSSQVLQEFVHQQDHFGGWLFVWTTRNLSTALLAKKSPVFRLQSLQNILFLSPEQMDFAQSSSSSSQKQLSFTEI